jgi:hypothetical protein
MMNTSRPRLCALATCLTRLETQLSFHLTPLGSIWAQPPAPFLLRFRKARSPQSPTCRAIEVGLIFACWRATRTSWRRGPAPIRSSSSLSAPACRMPNVNWPRPRPHAMTGVSTVRRCTPAIPSPIRNGLRLVQRLLDTGVGADLGERWNAIVAAAVALTATPIAFEAAHVTRPRAAGLDGRRDQWPGLLQLGQPVDAFTG